MGHVTRTTPLLGVVCHPSARICYSLPVGNVPEISLGLQNLKWVTWPWTRPS